jgi:hypothetical protein
MDRTFDAATAAATAAQGGVRRADDGVEVEGRDVGNEDVELHVLR